MQMIKKCIMFILIPLCIFIFVFLIYINFQNEKFLEMDFNDLITILLLISVSYFLVEKKSDERVLKEKIEETMHRIYCLLDTINLELFEDEIGYKYKYLRTTRQISNSIDLLIHYSKKLMFEDEIKYIKEKYYLLDSMIGNHITRPEELIANMQEIEQYKDLMQKRFDDIFKKLY